MPIENLEEEGLPKNPNLEQANWKFLLGTDRYKDDKELKQKLLEAIEANDMGPYYEDVCKELQWKCDEGFLQKMKHANETELKKLDESIEDAEKNLGETEVREFMLKKAEYLCQIGDKEGALSQFRKTQEKTVTLGYRLDLVFHLIRMGLFYMDHDIITRNLEKAQSLIDEGGDWDRRNRLKVYRGVYCMSIRDFKKAAGLFLDTVATFTSYELMDYQTFVTYTVFCGMIALDRPDLREKIVKGSEILEVLHSLPKIRMYLFSLYDCHYSEFFRALGFVKYRNLADQTSRALLSWTLQQQSVKTEVEDNMKYDRFLAPHYRYYTREMRIIAYTQLLESYRSLALDYMANAFGVTIEFIDQELARFIAAGRLHCKIDKVKGIVETNRPDSKNWQYQATIKQGDILLNRVQKLSRVINI